MERNTRTSTNEQTEKFFSGQKMKISLCEYTFLNYFEEDLSLDIISMLMHILRGMQVATTLHYIITHKRSIFSILYSRV